MIFVGNDVTHTHRRRHGIKIMETPCSQKIDSIVGTMKTTRTNCIHSNCDYWCFYCSIFVYVYLILFESGWINKQTNLMYTTRFLKCYFISSRQVVQPFHTHASWLASIYRPSLVGDDFAHIVHQHISCDKMNSLTNVSPSTNFSNNMVCLILLRISACRVRNVTQA